LHILASGYTKTADLQAALKEVRQLNGN
jgi:hypothetical protein